MSMTLSISVHLVFDIHHIIYVVVVALYIQLGLTSRIPPIAHRCHPAPANGHADCPLDPRLLLRPGPWALLFLTPRLQSRRTNPGRRKATIEYALTLGRAMQ
jgi:hypothetical protein